MYMHTYVSTAAQIWGTSGSWSSPSVAWVLIIKLRLSGLVTSAFTELPPWLATVFIGAESCRSWTSPVDWTLIPTVFDLAAYRICILEGFLYGMNLCFCFSELLPPKQGSSLV